MSSRSAEAALPAAPGSREVLASPRRGWMASTQLALIGAIAWLGALDPLHTRWLIGAMTLLLAFPSASQDFACHAYRTDLLSQPERGLGAALICPPCFP